MRKTTCPCGDMTKKGFIMRIQGLNLFVILAIFVIGIVLEAIFVPVSTSAGGLSASGNQMWNQDSADILGEAEHNDGFGYALSWGDFNNDGYADLAIGVPNEDIGSIAKAGMVNVLYGTAGGLSASGNQMWSQNSTDILDEAEENDNFGYALCSGDFNNDGYADLAIGVPYENIGSLSYAGMVNVLYGEKIKSMPWMPLLLFGD